MPHHATPQTCWNYVRGNCSRSKCKYYHPQGIAFPPYHRISPFGASQPLPLSSQSETSQCGTSGPPKVSSEMGDGRTTSLFTPVAWKTAPCKHFSEAGSCPRGNNCKFIHDMDLVRASIDARSSGGSFKSSTPSATAHCWSFIQGKCKNTTTCRYFHPPNREPYKKYTPCLKWPACTRNDCSFKHPEPLLDESKPLANVPAQNSFPVYSSTLYPMHSSSLSLGPPLITSPNPQEIGGMTYYYPSSLSPIYSGPDNYFPSMGPQHSPYHASPYMPFQANTTFVSGGLAPADASGSWVYGPTIPEFQVEGERYLPESLARKAPQSASSSSNWRLRRPGHARRITVSTGAHATTGPLHS